MTVVEVEDVSADPNVTFTVVSGAKGSPEVPLQIVVNLYGPLRVAVPIPFPHLKTITMSNLVKPSTSAIANPLSIPNPVESTKLTTAPARKGIVVPGFESREAFIEQRLGLLAPPTSVPEMLTESGKVRIKFSVWRVLACAGVSPEAASIEIAPIAVRVIIFLIVTA